MENVEKSKSSLFPTMAVTAAASTSQIKVCMFMYMALIPMQLYDQLSWNLIQMI